MLRRTAKVLAAAMGLVCATSAHGRADEVRGTRSSLLKEQHHQIVATLHRGYARWVVRRTVFNGGPRHDQAIFWLDVPEAGVATGLRTLGTVGGRPRWFDGDLLEAEEAARRYQELTGMGAYYPKDPALLSWRSQSRLALQVFPCAPAASKTIEYTIDMPLRYRDGAYRMPLPAFGTEDLLATVELRAGQPGDRLFADGSAVRNGGTVSLRRDAVLDVSLVPSQARTMEGELVVVTFGSRRVLTTYAVNVAPRVSTVPDGAQVVVVLDASRSLEPGVFDGMRSAAAAYLGHFRGADVQTIVFDRKPRTQFSSFLPVKDAIREISGMNVPLQNGSNIELAIAEAETLLAARRGTADKKRIVVMTDGLTRGSLAPGRIRGAIGASGGVVHIAIMGEGPSQLQRDDSHAWASAARSSGGLLWRGWAGSDPGSARAAFEQWARPKRIDNLQVVGFGMPLGSMQTQPPSWLEEGEGYRSIELTTSALTRIRVEGELWARPVQTTLEPTLEGEKRWSALVFGTELLDELSEEEMMTLAKRGGAVSPVTSYLAIEPGVRPSTEGLSEGELGIRRGTAPQVRMGATSMGMGHMPIDRDAFLRDALQGVMRGCGMRGVTVDVVMETNRAEVVDVVSVRLSGPRDAIGERCVTEGMWGTVLPSAFHEEWGTWLVTSGALVPAAVTNATWKLKIVGTRMCERSSSSAAH